MRRRVFAMEKITDVQFTTEQGHPYVEFLLDGEPAWASVEQNQILLKEGYIFLHPEEIWKERLQPVILPANTEYGWQRQTLTGFTTDKDVAALVLMYAISVRDGTFTPGPVDWPPKTGS